MSQLDQYAISRVLNSTISPVGRCAFGGLAVVHATAKALAARPSSTEPLSRELNRDRLIVAAFTAIFRGYSVDRVLCDPAQTSDFLKECTRLGVQGSPSQLLHRLLRIRKAADPELRLPKATARDRRDVSPFIVPAELASAQVLYRFGASIDDMLADPEIGGYFDTFVNQLRPDSDPIACRAAALHLRKNVRVVSEDENNSLTELESVNLETLWQPVSSLADFQADRLPSSAGIVALREPRRFLYITQQRDIRSTASFFTEEGTLAAVANRFWTPDPRHIDIQTIPAAVAEPWGLRLLELKALQIYQPLFNVAVAA